MNKKSANEVLDRLLQVFGVTTDSELCRIIKVNRGTLGNWRVRDSVPYSLCVELAEQKNISLAWLLTGDGEMIKGVEAVNDSLTRENELILNLYNQLTPEDRADAAKEIKKIVENSEMKRYFEQMKEKLKKVG
jgi:uncharacterized protein YwgA